jgi:3-deoxy-manno-octulosonate cytidylyltransferase (CMP-KDO synthetase)
MTSQILGIIPARYASTRFPGKALVKIQNKTMIQRVYEQASKSKLLTKILVATDNQQIYDYVQSFGGQVIMTKEEHQSGTDRCWEAYQNQNEKFDFIVNIQGDEPFIQPEQIDLLASVLNQNIELATLVIACRDKEILFSPNSVKVALNQNQEAIYFSRHPIPFIRNEQPENWITAFDFYRHIGIYAYRTDILEQITKLKPSSLEMAESLEQLRWIENGFKIKVNVTEIESHGIDTPEDLLKVTAQYVA